MPAGMDPTIPAVDEKLQQPVSPPSILIVDEDEVVLNTLTLQLQDKGWDVLTAGSSTGALELFQEHPAEVALVSVGMNAVNGMEVARLLLQQVPNLIVILMTGYPTLNEAIEGLHREAFDYLVKPFRIEQLTLCIQRARREQALIQENREMKQVVTRLEAELEKAARLPEPVEERPTEAGLEESALGATPHRVYPAAAPGGTDAIARYERQMEPAPAESPEEKPAEVPEAPEAEQLEGEQPQPDDG